MELSLLTLCVILELGIHLHVVFIMSVHVCTVGAHIFGRLFVLKNNLAKYRKTYSICSNLHHMIDMISSFKMLNIIIYKIHHPE